MLNGNSGLGGSVSGSANMLFSAIILGFAFWLILSEDSPVTELLNSRRSRFAA